MSASVWTPEMVDRLRALHAEGLSGSQIAAVINAEFLFTFSRNAIIGIMNRRGLRGNRPIATPRERSERRNVAKRTARAAYRKPLLDHAEDIMQAEPCDLPPDSSEFAVTFAELADQHCRWPIGDPAADDFKYCGAGKMDESPYCARHHRLAYVKPKAPAPRPAYSWYGRRGAA